MQARIEHVNYTVTDCNRTAARLCDLFGWHIRWQGPSLDNGHSVHVGTDDQYVALYSSGRPMTEKANNYVTTGGLNHIGVTVDDLDAAEERVKAAGFAPTSHADYEPGRRFYFRDDDGIEYEIVSYAQA